MTDTFDRVTAATAADGLVAKLLDGRQRLTVSERVGLAQLLRTIKHASKTTPRGDTRLASVAGSWDAVVGEYARLGHVGHRATADDIAAHTEALALVGDKGPEGDPRLCTVERSLGLPGCGVSDEDHPICCAGCPDTCHCTERTET